MNPMPALIPMLKEIRLSGILDSLEARNRQAIEEKLAYTDFLALLLQDEVAGLRKSLLPGYARPTSATIKPWRILTSSSTAPLTGP